MKPYIAVTSRAEFDAVCDFLDSFGFLCHDRGNREEIWDWALRNTSHAFVIYPSSATGYSGFRNRNPEYTLKELCKKLGFKLPLPIYARPCLPIE